MSQTRATAVWKEIKPFAIRDLAAMLEQSKTSSDQEGYFIILYDISGLVKREYSFSVDGLDAAIAAAVSGDVVWIPAGSISGGPWTVPAGVSVQGMGRNSIMMGQVILGDGSELCDLKVFNWDNLETDIITVIGPSTGSAYLFHCSVMALNCGAGDAIGLQGSTGAVDAFGCEISGESMGGNGYGVQQL
jgi:hypothetical protein